MTLASQDGIENPVFFSGALVGIVEETMDCGRGLDIGDITAWIPS